MNDIREKQYENLRKCFNENLVHPILGDNYYNLEMDVYSSDRIVTKDLKIKFDSKNKKIKLYQIIIVIQQLILLFFGLWR